MWSSSGSQTWSPCCAVLVAQRALDEQHRQAVDGGPGQHSVRAAVRWQQPELLFETAAPTAVWSQLRAT